MTKVTRKRRWHRFAIPLGLAFAAIIGTVIVHAILEPDTSEQHYLSPEKKADTSAVQLADLLRAKGITIQRTTRSSDALTATWAKQGDVTLFIPAPEFVHGDYLWMLRHSPAGTRVVLVEPGSQKLGDAVPRLGIVGKRWATAVTSRGTDCALTTAGPAAVTRTRYAELLLDHETPTAQVCYDHGLVSREFHQVEFVIAGSADAFRDDRLSENDNATLAVELLSTKKTLVWLDLHEKEPKPKTYSELAPPEGGQPIPSLGPGHERTRPDASPVPRPSVGELNEPEEVDAQAPEPPSPFPPWLLPGFLMLLLIAVVVAFARGRRLGAPVREPLPIDVRGAETAIGRSRLYRRAKARGAALETLRSEARRRLAAALKTTTDRDQLLDAVAARLGRDRELIADILYGSAPERDDELHTRSAELLLLVEQVTKGRS